MSAGRIKSFGHVGITTDNRDYAVALYTALLPPEGEVKAQRADKPYLSRITGHPGCVIDIAFLPAPVNTRIRSEKQPALLCRTLTC